MVQLPSSANGDDEMLISIYDEPSASFDLVLIHPVAIIAKRRRMEWNHTP